MGLLDRLYQYGDLDWFHPGPYIFDWLSVLGLWFFAWLVKFTVVFEREFSLDDPLIGHPHRHNTVGSVFNKMFALIFPIGCIAVVGLSRKSLHEVHHGIVAVAASLGMASLITHFMKHRIGRLRPDFLVRCAWDEALKKCTGSHSDILKGRKSFPSGHSSTAFAGFFLLSLWIAGQTGAWCLSTPFPPRYLSSKIARLILTVMPMAWALYVAMSRMSDYRHHKEDIIVGSLIGIVTATISYHMFWPNPLSYKGETPSPHHLYSTEDIALRRFERMGGQDSMDLEPV